MGIAEWRETDSSTHSDKRTGIMDRHTNKPGIQHREAICITDDRVIWRGQNNNETKGRRITGQLKPRMWTRTRMWTKRGRGQNWECGQHILTEAHRAVNRIAEPKLKSEPELEVNWNWRTKRNSDRKHWHWGCRQSENVDEMRTWTTDSNRGTTSD